jgi:hypothetical protein
LDAAYVSLFTGKKVDVPQGELAAGI